MPRSDDDTWDITESVGATALGVAAARAAESESANPLIEDPFARVFLDAAGEGMWNMWSATEMPPELTEIDPDLPVRMKAMGDYMACRTAFFDEFFLTAADEGVRQAVILAAGLDSRAWRLAWPDDTTVFELDQPKVLEFKSSTLLERGAEPSSRRVDVPVDLRHDWPTALRQHGFDPSAPSAWTAEGLLPFLPAQAQDLLFERIHALSASGSRVAVEAPGPDFLNPEMLERQRAMMERFRSAATKLKGTAIPDFDDLWYFEERTDVAGWLRGHGWEVSVQTAAELMAGYHRPAPEGIDDAAPGSLFVSAKRR